MPHALVALLPALIGAGSTAATIGTQLAGVGQPSQPKAQPAPPPGPSKDQAYAALSTQNANLNEAGEGGLSDFYKSLFAPLFAGFGGGIGSPGLRDAAASLFPGASAPFTATGVQPNYSALAANPGAADWWQKVAGGLTS